MGSIYVVSVDIGGTLEILRVSYRDILPEGITVKIQYRARYVETRWS